MRGSGLRHGSQRSPTEGVPKQHDVTAADTPEPHGRRDPEKLQIHSRAQRPSAAVLQLVLVAHRRQWQPSRTHLQPWPVRTEGARPPGRTASNLTAPQKECQSIGLAMVRRAVPCPSVSNTGGWLAYKAP